MRVMAGSLKAGSKVIAAQGSAQSLSKVLTLGGHYRMFFPLIQTAEGLDIVAATVPGRDLDWDALHMAFIAIDDIEENDLGKVKDVSGLADWKKIVNVIFDADYELAVANARRDAKEIAERSGDQIDALALNQKLRELELEYYGDSDAKPQAIYASKKPVMSGFKMITATEAFLVPLKEGGEPKWSAGQRVSVPMSGRKRAQLQALLEKSEYCKPGSKYLEVGYDYVGATKQAAGQAAAFQGISEDLSLKTKYPEIWAANAEGALSQLAKDGEGVAAGNMSMSSNVKVSDVIAALKKYISHKKLQLTYINFEKESTKQAARALLDNAICANLPSVEEKLRKVVAESGETKVEPATPADDMDLSGQEFADVKNAKSIKELAEAIPEGKSLGSEADDDGLDIL